MSLRDDDGQAVQQQQQQCGSECDDITASNDDHTRMIESIFAPCHDRLVRPSDTAVEQRRLPTVDTDDVCVSRTTSSTLDDLVSPSLAPYLACIVPPPPSLTDQLVSGSVQSVAGPPPLCDTSAALCNSVVMDVDPTALIVPPPPTLATPPQTTSAVLSSSIAASQSHPGTSASIKLAPATLPKQTRKWSDVPSKTSVGENPSGATSDVTSRGHDVIVSAERLVNGDVTQCLLNTVEFFPPPPPLDDVELPPLASDNLPPPPPSILTGTVQTSRRGGTSRLDNVVTSPSSSSLSSSSETVSSELAAAMLTARLRAESSTGLLNRLSAVT